MEEEKDFWKTQGERESKIHDLRVKEFEDCEKKRAEHLELEKERNELHRQQHADWCAHAEHVEKANELLRPLSFRDHCAIAAMQSFTDRDWDEFDEDDEGSRFPDAARTAFNLADTMEAERQKRSQK